MPKDALLKAEWVAIHPSNLEAQVIGDEQVDGAHDAALLETLRVNEVLECGNKAGEDRDFRGEYIFVSAQKLKADTEVVIRNG